MSIPEPARTASNAVHDMDTTAIAVGNGKLLSPESFQTMTITKET